MLFANHTGGLHTKEARLQLQCNSRERLIQGDKELNQHRES